MTSNPQRRSALFRITWPFFAVVCALMVLSFSTERVMSSVRAYIGGESEWSKGQKDAVLWLDRYALTRDPSAWRGYEQAIAIPQSLDRARQTLDSAHPDYAAARNSFLEGRIAPADVDDVILMFRLFRHVSYFDEAVVAWESGDAHIARLAGIAGSLRAEMQRPAPDITRIHTLLVTVWGINDAIVPWSGSFAEVLGESYRRTVVLLDAVDAVCAAFLLGLLVWRTRRLLRQRTNALAALRNMEARAGATLAAIGEAVVALRPDGSIEYTNVAARRLCGLGSEPAADLHVSHAFELLDELGQPIELLTSTPAASADGSWHDATLIRADATRVAVQAVVNRIVPGWEAASGVVVLLRRVAREREYVANLTWQATHDSLTGLLNRREFERCLTQTLTDAPGAGASGPGALMLLDLDQFKVINDSFGHAAGDAMLRAVSGQFREALREEDLLARVGGDEFAVLLNSRTPEAAEATAERLRAHIAAFTWHWASQPFNTTVSIGIVHLDRPSLDADTAQRLADLACYIAKGRGRDRVHVASDDDDEMSRLAGQSSWGRRIREAVDMGRLELFRQAILPVGGTPRKRQHAELLLRLPAQDGSVIDAQEFVPAARRYGLNAALDRWTVRTALQRIAVEGADTQYFINLSGALIGDERFVQYLGAQFDDCGVAPASVCFEVSEPVAIAALQDSREFFGFLRNLGCACALDNFGTGLSSLLYLRELPLDYIKIDGALIRRMGGDPVIRQMVRATCEAAHELGMRTIAEQVEDVATFDAIVAAGVDFAQGYHFSVPQKWLPGKNLVQHDESVI